MIVNDATDTGRAAARRLRCQRDSRRKSPLVCRTLQLLSPLRPPNHCLSTWLAFPAPLRPRLNAAYRQVPLEDGHRRRCCKQRRRLSHGHDLPSFALHHHSGSGPVYRWTSSGRLSWFHREPAAPVTVLPGQCGGLGSANPATEDFTDLGCFGRRPGAMSFHRYRRSFDGYRLGTTAKAERYRHRCAFIRVYPGLSCCRSKHFDAGTTGWDFGYVLRSNGAARTPAIHRAL